MGITGSKLNSRVAPSDITDDDTVVSTSAISVNTSTSKSSTNIPIINKFVLIWLDANLNEDNEVYQNSITQLQRITTSIHKFTNINDCTKFLSTIKNEKILMVISNDFVQEIWPRLRTMPQVHSVYIISQNGDKKLVPNFESDKLKGIFTKVEPIYNSVKRDDTQYKPDLLVMSIIPTGKYTKKDLPKLNRIFIYWMMVKLIIINGKNEREFHKESLKNLAEFSRHQYFNNTSELKIIDEFEKTYFQHSPIWWYTRNCFLSLMLNRAFQTQDLEIMMRMEFFINDLYFHIHRLQGETLKTNKLPLNVYQCHNVSNEDFEKIKNIKGNILSFNKFIIADSNYANSLNTVRRVRNNETGIGILFSIKIESKHTSTPFTLLQKHSYSSNQAKSILFFMHSIFRITDMKQIEERIWQIDLTLAANNDEQVRYLVGLLGEETKGSIGWLKLPQLMTMVRDFDQAKDIYQTILQLTPVNDVLKIACIYNELGNIDGELGDYTSALSYYQKAIELRREHLPPNHRSFGVAYNNIGEVQRQLGDYFNALSTHQKTLQIKRQNLSVDDLSLATTYNNIALANENLGEYPAALDFHQKALEIKQKSLPPDHQDIGTAYNNIGELERSMGNYSSALTYFEKALNIRLKKYSPMDPSLAIPYNNIGLIYRELGEYSKALTYIEKSIEVKLKTFTAFHPSLIFSYLNIGDINQQMGQFTIALASYQKALDIQLNVFTENHPEVATTYNNIGTIHQAMGQYATALQFYQKAVKIRQKTLPPNHPALGTCYNNLGHVYQSMGEYTTASEYYQKTFKIQEKSLRQNHPSFAATYNNLAEIQRKLGNYTKALTLYRKSLDIKKKSFPPNHPALVITYNNIGVVHQAMNNYPAALESYKQTLEIQKKALPPDHPDLAAVHNNIGAAHQTMKEYPKALEHYKEALEILEKAFSFKHPDIATIHNSMATVCIHLEDYKSALEHAEIAVDIASQTLGADHPNLQIFKDYHERIRVKVESTSTT